MLKVTAQLRVRVHIAVFFPSQSLVSVVPNKERANATAREKMITVSGVVGMFSR